MKKLFLAFALSLPAAFTVYPVSAQSVSVADSVRSVYTDGYSLFIHLGGTGGVIQIELEDGKGAYLIEHRKRVYAVKFWRVGNKGFARVNGRVFEVRRVQKSVLRWS